MDKKYHSLIIVIVISLLYTSIPVGAQMYQSYNASYYYNPDIIFTNPAGIAFSHRIQGSIGTQLLWPGLSGDNLTNSYSGLIFPSDSNNTLGLRCNLFNSNLSRQGNVSFLIGRTFSNEKLSIGINTNYLFYSYNTDEFYLVDENDPLLAGKLSKNAFSLGFGFLYNPNDWLSFGGSVDHINRPDISIEQTNFRKHPIFLLGTHVSYFPIVPYLNLQIINEDVLYNGGISRQFLNQQLCLDVGMNYIKSYQKDVFTKINIDFSSFRVTYKYLYPLSDLNTISWGSHLFTFSYSKGGMRYPKRDKNKKQIIVDENPELELISKQTLRFDSPLPNELLQDSLLFINGKEVKINTYHVNKNDISIECLGSTVQLNKPGLNLLFNPENNFQKTYWEDEEESNCLKEFELPYKNSHAVIVAIDEYDRKNDPKKRGPIRGYESLDSMVVQAKKLKKTLQNIGFPLENIHTYFNEHATSTNVDKILKSFYQGGSFSKADRLLFYFGGHGDTLQDNGILITYDFDPMRPKLTSIVMEDLIGQYCRDSITHHMLIALDACYSGLTQLSPQIKENEIKKRVTLDIIKRDTKFKARNLIVAGTKNQKAAYKSGGIFTKYLIKGLRGYSDYNKDGIIQFEELGLYVRNNVSSEVYRSHKIEQNPQFIILDSYGEGRVIFRNPFPNGRL